MKFIQTILSIAKILIRSKFGLKKLRGSGDSVVILGNGPSAIELLQTDKLIDNVHQILCVNMFANSEYFFKVKPKYYLLLDHAFFEFTEENFNSPNTHSRIINNPDYLKTQIQVSDMWNNILAADWELEIWIPQLYRNNFIVNFAIRNNIKIHVFNYTVTNGFTWFENWVYKSGLGSPQCQNVINMAIFQAINAGFNRIYLAGVNNNFHQSLVVLEDNSLHVKYDHFYKLEQKTFPLKVDLGRGSSRNMYIHEQFYLLYKAFKSYHRLRQFADYRNKKVINISKDSFVDAFERGAL